MNSFGIANPPIAAVVAHGTGAESVEQLEKAVCGESLLWLLQAGEGLRESGADGVALGQFEAIVRGLVGLGADAVCGLFRDVLWRAWLAELRGAMDARLRPDRVDRLLWQLPVLLAPLLRQLDPLPVWKAALPGPRRLAPLGGDVYLSSSSGDDLSIEVVDDGDDWTVFAGGRRFQSRTVGTLGPVTVTARPRLLRGIDVLDAASFPELAANRRSIEVTSPAPTAQLDRQLADALAHVAEGWPAAVGDVAAFCRGVFPISSGPGHWNSASTDALPLALQLSFPDASMPLELGESLLHETAHVKLDLLMTMAPLLENGAEGPYHHPWREDPRPLRGVLIGAHAFLNVVLYYDRMIGAGLGGAHAGRQFEKRQGEVLAAFELLSRHARFTPEGSALFEGMVGALRGADCRV